MAEVEFYDYEIELHTKYMDRTKVTTKEAFGHLEGLEPKRENAFLFDKRISGRW